MCIKFHLLNMRVLVSLFVLLVTLPLLAVTLTVTVPTLLLRPLAHDWIGVLTGMGCAAVWVSYLLLPLSETYPVVLCAGYDASMALLGGLLMAALAAQRDVLPGMELPGWAQQCYTLDPRRCAVLSLPRDSELLGAVIGLAWGAPLVHPPLLNPQHPEWVCTWHWGVSLVAWGVGIALRALVPRHGYRYRPVGAGGEEVHAAEGSEEEDEDALPVVGRRPAGLGRPINPDEDRQGPPGRRAPFPDGAV